MPAVLPSLHDVRALAPAFAASAQRVYDAWEQDEDGMDEVLGGGGICDLIADAILADIRSALGNVRASTKLLNCEQHVTVSVAVREGVYDIDVPHSVYERGAGFVWKKIPDVVFGPEDVTFLRLSGDPSDLWMFAEDLEPDEDETEAESEPSLAPAF